MKIRPVGPELFDTDGHETNSRFSQLCERAKKKCIQQVGKCNNVTLFPHSTHRIQLVALYCT